VYFKAPWKSAFEPHANTHRPFYLQEGRQVDVLMMHNEAFLAHVKTDAFEAVRLPYVGNRFGLILFLPRGGSTVEALVKRLADKPWSEVDEGFQEARCNLTIPKFRVDYEAELKTPLKQMGMAAAFDPATADFRRMLEDESRLYIENVIHKTFLRVDEAGSEAAAVTGVRDGACGPDARAERGKPNLRSAVRFCNCRARPVTRFCSWEIWGIPKGFNPPA
jgi:serpin B